MAEQVKLVHRTTGEEIQAPADNPRRLVELMVGGYSMHLEKDAPATLELVRAMDRLKSEEA
jgi:hypothetical protein